MDEATGTPEAILSCPVHGAEFQTYNRVTCACGRELEGDCPVCIARGTVRHMQSCSYPVCPIKGALKGRRGE